VTRHGRVRNKRHYTVGHRPQQEQAAITERCPTAPSAPMARIGSGIEVSWAVDRLRENPGNNRTTMRPYRPRGHDSHMKVGAGYSSGA
jgi:hypothetical protein